MPQNILFLQFFSMFWQSVEVAVPSQLHAPVFELQLNPTLAPPCSMFCAVIAKEEENNITINTTDLSALFVIRNMALTSL